MSTNWSNLAKIVYKRTYSRQDGTNVKETWSETVKRVIEGNIGKYRGTSVLLPNEEERLNYFLTNRKAGPAGRGWWFSGAPSHVEVGGAALVNCWGLTADDWQTFVLAMDLLMLGGGTGMSVEHRYVSKLPKVRKGVAVVCKNTRDADYIVSDSRMGWCMLLQRVLESFFVTGKSFTYSTVCIRGAGEPIKGFGGTASGPLPLVEFVAKLSAILIAREGRHVRPIDAGDMLCAIGELVVSGNIRRSAIILLGDPWDKEYLTAKRWDLGQIPTYRSCANYTVVCDDIADLPPLYWKGYEQGEAFGILNRKAMRSFGRMGEKKKDSAMVVNPCVITGTEVLTSQGYRAIETLVGTKTDVWNGFEWSTVVPALTGTRQEVLKITFSDGRSLTCTFGHKFVISTDYRGGTSKVTADALKPGDKLIKHKYPVIEGGERVDWAYSQGFLSGDGMDDYSYFSVYGDKVKCIPRMHVKVGAYSAKRDRTHAGIRFDTLPKNFVPFQWAVQSRLDWLAGLIDSDGTRTNEGGCQIASVDFTFLEDVQKLLSMLGVQSKVCLGNEAGDKEMPDGKGGIATYACQECRRILIGATQIQDLLALGLRTERVDFEAAPQRDASRFTTVLSVEPAGVADKVYCFTEPKRHLGCFNGIVTMNCGEATLESKESCNLQDLPLPNLDSIEEFEEAARLMHRWGKRVTMEKYHDEDIQEVVARNRRIGTGITGCLQAPQLFNPQALDRVYEAVQDENRVYSRDLGIPESIRTTVVKPSGTLSKMFDCSEGIHAAFSRYAIQRIRFASNDSLLPILRAAGHYMEPQIQFDGSADPNTMVVDFYVQAPAGTPVADEDWDTWKQLDTLKLVQKHWSDQAVSVTVYYKKDEIYKVKEWLSDNLSSLKTISFLCHNDHGYKQAPKEAVTKDEFEKRTSSIKAIDIDAITGSDLESQECEGGVCPIK